MAKCSFSGEISGLLLTLPKKPRSWRMTISLQIQFPEDGWPVVNSRRITEGRLTP